MYGRIAVNIETGNICRVQMPAFGLWPSPELGSRLKVDS